MCDCLEQMDKHLAQFGAAIQTSCLMPSDGSTRRMVPIIKTGRVSVTARKKTPIVHANFCPWCGEEIKRIPTGKAAYKGEEP